MCTKLEQEIEIRTPMLEQHWYTFMFPKINPQYTIKRDGVLRFNMLPLKHQIQYSQTCFMSFITTWLTLVSFITDCHCKNCVVMFRDRVIIPTK